jgi:hypothetical protein
MVYLQIEYHFDFSAVALVGDIYEVYMSVIKNLFFKIKGWFSFTPKGDDVLIPETDKKP